MRDRETHRLETAAFRYRIIAEAAELGEHESGVTQEIADAAAKECSRPDGEVVTRTERTLWDWLDRYEKGGLQSLMTKERSDKGKLRAIAPEILEFAANLRLENKARPTKTLIDILVNLGKVKPGELKRSTLDRHLDLMGVTRKRLRKLAKKVFRKILTTRALELVVVDFHDGPYVRVEGTENARKSLLLAFIDHFSRKVLEARYYLHEDYEALRFGFRRLLLIVGLFELLYMDNGGAFQSTRFHLACKNELLNIKVVHSKAYEAESRAIIERFNRTVKEQFESEVRERPELLTLDELNAFFEAWLAERYHQDINSETGEAPFERFQNSYQHRPAPDLALIDELLRLRKSAKVHKQWSTVEVKGLRYVVDPALRGRRVFVLYDPFAPEYVLIEHQGKILQRAEQQKAGVPPPQPDPELAKPNQPPTDYLALLKKKYDQRVQAELGALRIGQPPKKNELTVTELMALLEVCREGELTAPEQNQATAFYRKMRPIEPEIARTALEAARRRLGTALHLSVYLEQLQRTLVTKRSEGAKKK